VNINQEKLSQKKNQVLDDVYQNFFRVKTNKMKQCKLCDREVKTTEHHLIPKTKHANKKIKKLYTSEQLHETVSICRECHKTIHACIDEKTLALEYNSVEKLLEHEEIAKFVKWIQKHPDVSKVKVKKTNR